MGCVQSRGLGAHASSSEVYLPGYDSRHSLGWVLFNLGISLSRVWGSLWAVSKVESLVHTSRHPRFILLGSFSDIFIVVSILGMVYDYHLQLLLQS